MKFKLGRETKKRATPSVTEESITQTRERSLAKITEEVVSALASTSQRFSLNLDHLYESRAPLVLERNALLDSFFSFLPNYKKRVAEIDAKLDQLDSAILDQEKSPLPTVNELARMIESAQSDLRKSLQLLGENVS